MRIAIAGTTLGELSSRGYAATGGFLQSVLAKSDKLGL
jgi:hypothetical protein